MEKTLEMHLAELREQIAREIETGSYIVPQNGTMLKEAIKQAASIARGK